MSTVFWLICSFHLFTPPDTIRTTYTDGINYNSALLLCQEFVFAPLLLNIKSLLITFANFDIILTKSGIYLFTYPHFVDKSVYNLYILLFLYRLLLDFFF
jgi:hypothetical protein